MNVGSALGVGNGLHFVREKIIQIGVSRWERRHERGLFLMIVWRKQPFGYFASFARNNSEEGLAFGTVDDAGDAVLEVGFVEVDQESELKRNQSKIVVDDFFEEIDD